MTAVKPTIYQFIVDEYIGFDGAYGILDKDKLHRLVDTYYYQNALIFNTDTGTRNHQSMYLGYEINDIAEFEPFIMDMKHAIESERWAARLEMAGYAIMPINEQNYPGYGKPLNGPVADADGHAIVTNIIWRDRASRQLYPMSNTWTCGDVYDDPVDVLNLGIAEFADTVAQVDLFRRHLGRNQKLTK